MQLSAMTATFEIFLEFRSNSSVMREYYAIVMTPDVICSTGWGDDGHKAMCFPSVVSAARWQLRGRSSATCINAVLLSTARGELWAEGPIRFSIFIRRCEGMALDAHGMAGSAFASQSAAGSGVERVS